MVMQVQGIGANIVVNASYLPSPTSTSNFGETVFITNPVTAGANPIAAAGTVVKYATLAAMSDDNFSPTVGAHAYNAAVRFFSQSPYPRYGLNVVGYDTDPATTLAAIVNAGLPDWYFMGSDATEGTGGTWAAADTAMIDAAIADVYPHMVVKQQYLHNVVTPTLSAATSALVLSGGQSDRLVQIYTGNGMAGVGPVAGALAHANEYADMGLIGKMAGINFNGLDTLIDPAFKPIIGATPIELPDAQVTILNDALINRYSRVAGSNVLLRGQTSSPGRWMDSRVWLDWMVWSMQRALWGLVVSARPRIPQNAIGVASVANRVEQECRRGVRNGGIGPGRLNDQSIAQIRGLTGLEGFDGYLPNGFFVFIDSVENLTPAQIGNRDGPPIYIWFKSIGSIHNMDIQMIFQN